MKRNNHSLDALALILGATLCTFTPGLSAQSSGTNPQNPPPQGQQQETQNKTFTGKVQKLPSGQYALVTGQTAEGKLSGHFLDDQEKSKKYEGKEVKVTGQFDNASNMIHVTNIEPQ